MTHTEDEIRRLREALLDATAHLAGAASAYRQYARRDTGIMPKAETDAFFSTRVVDFDNAVERARAAYAALDDLRRFKRGGQRDGH